MRAYFKKYRLEISLEAGETVNLDVHTVDDPNLPAGIKQIGKVMLGTLHIKTDSIETLEGFALEGQKGNYNLISTLPISITSEDKIIMSQDFIEQFGILKEGYAEHLNVVLEGLNSVFSELL